ncbi:flagellar hook-associated protein FlgK [Kineococcus arenarius]|uniref:flagellar hook-associated protein FlgK n=1 Tax=unclassified Kineococcus TaxID=2621656 RepID=UPI003D7E95AD
MSTFSGLNTTSKALAAAQRAMEVTGQNIANANTTGYTRQRVELTSAAITETGRNARRDVPGSGVDVVGIDRVTDAFVDATRRQDVALSAEAGTASTIWTTVEGSLGEPGSGSLTSRLTDMYNSWGDLSNAQGSDAVTAARATVIARSQAVADTLSTVDGQLQGQWFGLKDQIGALAVEVNETAARIAELNTSIVSAKVQGSSANELMDKRDQFVSRLAELTGAHVVQRDLGTVDVYIGNATLVSGAIAETFSVTGAGVTFQQVKGGTGEQVGVQIGKTTVAPASGKLKALLEGVNSTLPGVARRLDEVATTIADQVNANYAGGTTPFFSATPADPSSRGPASSLKVLVTGTSDAEFQDSSAGSVDRASAKAIARLPETDGSPSKVWRGSVTAIATASQAAENRAAMAADVALKSDAARESVSGVSIDEEMTNLVAFQHAYAAAARVFTAIDEALDILINRTGA